jgi:hypothetical protein
MRIAALRAGNFHTLRPGQSRIVYRWRYKLEQAGLYKFSAGYANTQDGKDFKLQDVWKTRVESNELIVEVGPSAGTAAKDGT